MVNAAPAGLRDPTDTFHVSFNTLEMPGKIVATTVRITKEIAGPDAVFRVDLRDHPLYGDLARYVIDNPPQGVTFQKIERR